MQDGVYRRGRGVGACSTRAHQQLLLAHGFPSAAANQETVVHSIARGVVDDYNKAHSSRKVVLGDQVVEVLLMS